MCNCVLNCSGLFLQFYFNYPGTRLLFDNYLTDSPDIQADCQISVTPEYMEECRWLIDKKEYSMAALEFQSLMLATGNFLLGYNRALFHGAAFLWKDKAWILTAPSGTGKTTQLRHWVKLLKKDVKIINGDKPLLECRNDGSVWVSSSPWRGKERYGKPGLSAMLGGIIFLEQGNENKIIPINSEEMVLPLFNAFISYPESVEQISQQAKILKCLLHAVPKWKLINVGDEDSASLTIKTLTQYLEEKR